MLFKILHETYGHIKYIDHNHSYIDTKNNNKRLISVTQLIDKYKEKFDTEFHSMRMSLKPKEERTQEQIKADWKKGGILGAAKGTILHNYLENLWNNKLYEIDYSIIPQVNSYDFIQFHDTVSKLIKMGEDYYNDSKNIIPIKTELIIGNDKVAGQTDLLAYDTEIDGYVLVDYKGLALDTPIPTESGFKLMKDIKVEDVIFDGNGKLTKVKHVSNVHYNSCYKIIFNTNEEIIADNEHKWVIFNGTNLNNSKEFEVDSNYLYEYFKKNGTKNKIRIKNHNGIETYEKELPIHPYVLGLWLGDGNSHYSTITCNNDKIWKEIENLGYKLSDNLEKDKNKCPYRTIYDIRKHLKDLSLLNNKHIPDIYLRGSYNQRLELLKGFMDADGYYNKKRNRYVMVTTKKWQAEDLLKLINTFGISATIIKARTSGFGKTNIPCFHVTFKTKDFPFKIRNQEHSNNYYSARSNYKYIKSVEKVDTVPTKCISVESDDHTYLFGYGMIKTHNTDKKIDYKSFYKKTMLNELSHLDDCEINKYSLQLSFYKYLLKPVVDIKEMYVIWFNVKNDTYKKIKLKNLELETRTIFSSL